MKYIRTLTEKEKLKWQDSDAPDANGRFRDLSPKDLAAWLIKTRKGDMKKISGSLSQQVAFNKNDDPEYAKKMDKTRIEVYKQMDREDLLESVDTDDLKTAKEYLSNPHTILDITYGKTRRGDKFVRFDYENKYVPGKMLDSGPHFVKVFYDNDRDLKKISKELNMDLKESVLNEEDTWNDYPAAAKKNAQKAIDWKEKYGRDEVDAGTPVGWARAHQLAKGENLSTDTVKRMSAFNRHRKNSSIKPELKETPWKDRGYVAWLIWGGDEGVDWAIEKSKEIDAMKESKQMKHIKPLSERAKHSSTDFSKSGNDGDIYFSKREGDAVGIRQGDKLQMIYVFQEEPKLGRIQKSDKRWENMGPASEKLLIDLRGREEGKILFDFVLTLEESVDEVRRSMVSGTSGRTVSSLEYRKYELKKDVEDAKIGDFINVTLPKGTIIYNLPGGVFADHFALKQRYASRSSRGPQYFDKPTFKGMQIISKHDTLTAIENNSKVLESVNEAKMPKKYIGNDEIVFLKTKEDSRGAHYNLYYKGHDIEAGGARFGSEKELEDFAANYILSNQWYKKLRYEDSIPLPEAFVGPFVFNDKMSDDELKAMYNGALDGYSYYAKGMQYPKSDYKKAYQEIEKILNKRGVDINEAKLSTVHRAAKKGSYPAVIVVVQDGKVIHQEPVSTPDVAPATFNVMQKEYPKALLHLEDKTGKRLFSESVVTEGMSKSAIKKAIKVIDQQIEDEEGGDGEPLDNETLQALEQERERLLGMNERKYIKSLNEGYWSHYDYDKWTKENGKPKYPKWVKSTLKEIVKGGFMEEVYDAEHNYMVLWLASLENKRRSELYAYDKKGVKEFGKVGYAMYQRFYNDLTGYNMFFMQGAMYALEVSKHIQDRIANGEPVEPAYYMMKEYFNSFGMDTKRSRVFNAAYEKLEKWMKDNQIKTL